MATMGQVASRANVSLATVSHVMGGSADRVRISKQTQKRVLDVAEELGYHRNMLARAIVTGKSRIIAILTADLLENIVHVLAGAMEAASERDYLLKLIHVPYTELDTTAIKRCQEWCVAGAMIVGLSEVPQRQFRQEFQQAQIPLALVDNASLSDWGVRFISDDMNGLSEAVNHLVNLGHRRIAYLGGKPCDLTDRRESYFRAVMANAGLSVPEHWIQNTSWREHILIAEAAHVLLREDDRPTAIVCSADAIAMTVIRVADSLGLRVPTDLSVIGYSNASLGSFANPPLTTVDIPFHAMGHAAATYLIECVENETVNHSIGPRPEVLLPTQLIVRESTVRPPE